MYRFLSKSFCTEKKEKLLQYSGHVLWTRSSKLWIFTPGEQWRTIQTPDFMSESCIWHVCLSWAVHTPHPPTAALVGQKWNCSLDSRWQAAALCVYQELRRNQAGSVCPEKPRVKEALQFYDTWWLYLDGEHLKNKFKHFKLSLDLNLGDPDLASTPWASTPICQ